MPPVRQRIKRFVSNEVQGEGSWIEIRGNTVNENKALQELKDDPDAYQAASEENFAARIVRWNWVDDDGNLLPLPSENPDIADALTEWELQFIGRCIAGMNTEKKQ